MKLILETKRLQLREFELSDAAAFFELNSDEEVLKYTGDPPYENIQAAEELIANYKEYERYGFGRNTVVLKDTKEIIGWCGLKRHANGMVDLGYRFFQKYWGYGYATESSMAIIDYGFKNFSISEIVGRTAQENRASIRVLEKVGMNFWKIDECEGIENSRYYKILLSEWQARK